MFTSSSADVYTDFTALAKLKVEAKSESPEAKKKVAQQFEGLLLQMMLKSMRETTLENDGFIGSQGKLYHEMFDQQISLQIAGQGGFGIAEVIYRQLGGEGNLNSPSTSDLSLPIRFTDSKFSNVLNNSSNVIPAWQTSDNFVSGLYPFAAKAAEKIGLKPEVILSVAALETGWGKHMPQDQLGNNSYNLFGIKASNDWLGKKIASPTLEFEQGVMQKKYAFFRAYNKPEDSVFDFVSFLTENPRYSDALKQAHNPEKFILELKKAGYATDPNYDQKLLSILKSETLSNGIETFKKTQLRTIL